MMFSFVVPELILAVSLFLLVLNAFRFIGLGTTAQLIGLVVLAVAYPVVIVRARLLSLGSTYEEAAADRERCKDGQQRLPQAGQGAPPLRAGSLRRRIG
jgi:ABC-type Fe3+ transport system permease subunit